MRDQRFIEHLLEENKCLNCGRDLRFFIEFGNPNLTPFGCDGDGYLCSEKCKQEYLVKVEKQLQRICDMTDSEFSDWLKN
jgi:hypothetical protein